MSDEQNDISISSCIWWVFGYFCVMLLYTFIDIVLWRKMPVFISEWLNILTIIICTCIYLVVLVHKTGLNLKEKLKLNLKSVVLAVCCATFFYLLLDCFIDPVIEGLFPLSEENYQNTISGLKENIITGLIRVCIIAPVTEEILIRGFVLDSLKRKYSVALALLISTMLFALLHFNMVQTLSALVSGCALGILYLKTDSLASTMLAHSLYNLISFLVLIL